MKIINFKILKAFTKVPVLKLQNVKRKHLGRHKLVLPYITKHV